MKKIYTYALLAVVFLCAGGNSASARKRSYDGNITFSTQQVQRTGGMLTTGIDMNINSLDLHNQQMVVLTPVLKSKDGLNEYRYAPVMVVGKTRNRALNRSVGLRNVRLDPQPAITVVYDGRSEQQVFVPLETPYESWMRESSLVIEEVVSGCADGVIGRNEYPLIDRMLPPLRIPVFSLAYLAEAEPVKAHSETHSAHINFRVGRYEILRNFMNNSNELSRVDDIIKGVSNDKNLKITEFKITGYASPEGNFQSNLRLSENRARSFARYLVSTHNISDTIFDISWKGEDWEGLRKAVSESDLDNKNEILSIIDIPDIQQRKSRIEALGVTYTHLLHTYYPPLRRNEYMISYAARPLMETEARGITNDKPRRVFPNDSISLFNAATLDIQRGALDQGIERSRQFDIPEALNNIGVAYIYKQDYENARTYLTLAANRGNAIAAKNLSELNLWLKGTE